MHPQPSTNTVTLHVSASIHPVSHPIQIGSQCQAIHRCIRPFRLKSTLFSDLLARWWPKLHQVAHFQLGHHITVTPFAFIYNLGAAFTNSGELQTAVVLCLWIVASHSRSHSK